MDKSQHDQHGDMGAWADYSANTDKLFTHDVQEADLVLG